MNTNAALWLSDAILAVTAFLVGWYAVATQKLVRTSQQQVQAAQDQLKELEKQLTVSQEQVRASQQQVEAQWRPAIAILEDGGYLQFSNIGNGPALTVECRLKDRDVAPDFNDAAPSEVYPFLELKQPYKTRFKASQVVARALHCMYRSISGRRYISVAIFTEKGIVETGFFVEEGSVPRPFPIEPLKYA